MHQFFEYGVFLQVYHVKHLLMLEKLRTLEGKGLTVKALLKTAWMDRHHHWGGERRLCLWQCIYEEVVSYGGA